jgi:nitroreductase
MKRTIIAFAAVFAFTTAFAQENKNITLAKPQLKKGSPVMQALNERKAVRQFADKELDNQTLSNLLWAATGVNREDGRRTNPTAMNRQEIDIYACLKSGAYFYNTARHELEYIQDIDCRQNDAPVTLLIAADLSKTSEIWAGVDAGIVSQNISIFASGMGLATVPRGQMPAEKFSKALKLKETQKLILNHPVGYPKQTEKAKK